MRSHETLYLYLLAQFLNWTVPPKCMKSVHKNSKFKWVGLCSFHSMAVCQIHKLIYHSGALKSCATYGNSVLFLQRSEYICLHIYTKKDSKCLSGVLGYLLLIALTFEKCDVVNLSWIFQNYLKYFNRPVSIAEFYRCTGPVVAGLSNIFSKFKLYKPINMSPCIRVAFKSHFKVMQKRYRSYFSAQIST